MIETMEPKMESAEAATHVNESRSSLAAAVGDLDRAVTRVALGTVAALARREDRPPTRTDVARVIVGRRSGESTAGVLERALGGILGRVTVADVLAMLSRLEEVALLERVGPQSGRVLLTAVGEEVARGRGERASGALRVLYPAPMDADPRFSALRVLRTTLAQAEGVSPGYLLSNRVLRTIAARSPETIDALRLVPGIGDVKAKRYGARILETLRSVKVDPPAATGPKSGWDAHAWSARDFGAEGDRAQEDGERYGSRIRSGATIGRGSVRVASHTIWVR